MSVITDGSKSNKQPSHVSSFTRDKELDVYNNSLSASPHKPHSPPTLSANWDAKRVCTKVQRTRAVVGEFGSETSIHGIPFWLDSQRGPTRWVYLVLWLALLGCCISLLYMTFFTYFLYEFSITVKTEQQIESALPGLTICPYHGGSMKSSMGGSKFFVDISKEGNWETPEEVDITCRDDTLPDHFINASYYSYIVNHKYGGDVPKAMASLVLPNINSVFLKCRLSKKVVNCSDIFFARLTHEGICYTFNYNASVRSAHDQFIWTYGNTKMRVVKGSGQPSALSLEMNALDSEVCVSMSSPIIGFRVGIHGTSNLPSSPHPSVIVGPGMRTQISVRETLTDRRLTEAYGSCSDSVRLRLFEQLPYTRHNCVLECMAAEIWEGQTLVPVSRYTLPIPSFQNEHSMCWGDSRGSMCMFDFREKVAQDFSLSNCSDKKICPDACLTRSYAFTSSSAAFPPSNMMRNVLARAENRGFRDEAEYRASVAALDVQLESLDLNVVTESLAMSPSALFNNIGGSLGLFLGISLFSLIEVVTFLLRLLCGKI